MPSRQTDYNMIYTINVSFTDFNLKIKISTRLLILIFKLKSVNDKCIIFSVYDIWRGFFIDFLLYSVDLIWWLVCIHLLKPYKMHV